MKTNAKQLAAVRRAMEVIAVREGISVEEVRREISLAHTQTKKQRRTQIYLVMVKSLIITQASKSLSRK